MCIRSWNINGSTPLKIACPDIIALIEDCDILLLQETHLRKDEDLLLHLPPNYSSISTSRPVRHSLGSPRGGVAAIYKSHLPVVKHRATRTDILVLEIGSLILVNAYLPPASSPTWRWLEVDPMQSLVEVLIPLLATERPLVLTGDLNARTADLRPTVEHPVRLSLDPKCNSRGLRLLAAAREYGLSILNGTVLDRSLGALTSFHYNGSALVDYCIVSSRDIDLVCGMVTEPKLQHSDHAPLVVWITIPTTPAPTPRQYLPKLSIPPLSVWNPLRPMDILLKETLKSVLSDRQLIQRIYGTVHCNSGPTVRVYTDGSCLHQGTPQAQAGSGVFWGVNSARNHSERLPLPATSNRGELLAVTRALEMTDPRVNLCVVTDSQYSIRTVCYWAPRAAQCGWDCENADIIRYIADLLSCRLAPLRLEWVKGHSGNMHNDAADRLANSGALLPLPSAPAFRRSPLPPLPAELPPTLNLPKVSTALPEFSTPRQSEPQPLPGSAQPATSHRGRSTAREVRRANRDSLVNATSVQSFWKLVRHFLHPRPKPSPLSLQVVADRMATLFRDPNGGQHQFSASVRREADDFMKSLPQSMRDRSAGQFFDRPISTDEVGEGKSRLRKLLTAAPGIDGIPYSDIMDIDNEQIANLINTCLNQEDAPSMWLIALVMALLKKGKAAADPKSYRPIVMECCFLKLVTILLDTRIRAWADSISLLPPTQNGFRPGYRTNNNPFILSVAITQAQSRHEPLYIAFVDLSNAFPSVDHPNLWRKLHHWGASGKIINWLRMLYASLRYRVRHDGSISDAFLAWVGILQGDPSSPGVFTLYISDFVTPEDVDDVILAGLIIAHLEHADDMALLSRSIRGLQRKLDVLAAYAADNFLVINASKTVAMAFNSPPSKGSPTFTINGQAIATVPKHVFVGVTFSSSTRRHSEAHYDGKSESAESVADITLALESSVGRLTPQQGVTLYMARIDPHLTHAADIYPDAIACHLKRLELVQRSFLRRIINAGPHCNTAALYSELGLWPLGYRRALIALRFLVYCASLPDGHLVRAAMEEAEHLDRMTPSRGWRADLRAALLLKRVSIPSLDTLRSDRGMAEVMFKQLRTSLRDFVHHGVQSAPKLYILHDRTEIGPGGNSKPTPLTLQPYLRIPNAPHRYAITRLVLSGYPLAIELLRHRDRRQRYIPPDMRTCRLCLAGVEDAQHVLFGCADPTLVDLRGHFLLSVTRQLPGIRVQAGLCPPLSTLQRVLVTGDADSLAALGKLAFNAVEYVTLSPMKIPTAAELDAYYSAHPDAPQAEL